MKEQEIIEYTGPIKSGIVATHRLSEDKVTVVEVCADYIKFAKGGRDGDISIPMRLVDSCFVFKAEDNK